MVPVVMRAHNKYEDFMFANNGVKRLIVFFYDKNVAATKEAAVGSRKEEVDGRDELQRVLTFLSGFAKTNRKDKSTPTSTASAADIVSLRDVLSNARIIIASPDDDPPPSQCSTTATPLWKFLYNVFRWTPQAVRDHMEVHGSIPMGILELDDLSATKNRHYRALVHSGNSVKGGGWSCEDPSDGSIVPCSSRSGDVGSTTRKTATTVEKVATSALKKKVLTSQLQKQLAVNVASALIAHKQHLLPEYHPLTGTTEIDASSFDRLVYPKTYPAASATILQPLLHHHNNIGQVDVTAADLISVHLKHTCQTLPQQNTPVEVPIEALTKKLLGFNHSTHHLLSGTTNSVPATTDSSSSLVVIRPHVLVAFTAPPRDAKAALSDYALSLPLATASRGDGTGVDGGTVGRGGELRTMDNWIRSFEDDESADDASSSGCEVCSKFNSIVRRVAHRFSASLKKNRKTQQQEVPTTTTAAPGSVIVVSPLVVVFFDATKSKNSESASHGIVPFIKLYPAMSVDLSAPVLDYATPSGKSKGLRCAGSAAIKFSTKRRPPPSVRYHGNLSVSGLREFIHTHTRIPTDRSYTVEVVPPPQHKLPPSSVGMKKDEL
eukprot:GHVS01106574.1.p1 GENE.GHVS01106574.1~~GHVS01106574.1.p1  ORF type:complete len:605 (-),score=129.33 GHVS01106574.1:207-2021(-)